MKQSDLNQEEYEVESVPENIPIKTTNSNQEDYEVESEPPLSMGGIKVFPTKESLAGSMKTLGDIKAAVEAGLYKTTAIPEVVGGAIEATVGPEMATAKGPGLDSAWMQRYQTNKGAIEQFLNEQQARSPIIGGAAEMAATLASPTPKIKGIKTAVETIPKIGKYLAPSAERVAGITALGAGEAALKGEDVTKAAKESSLAATGMEAVLGGVKGLGTLAKGTVGWASDLVGKFKGFTKAEMDLYRKDPAAVLNESREALVKAFSEDVVKMSDELKNLQSQGATLEKQEAFKSAMLNQIKKEQDEALMVAEASRTGDLKTATQETLKENRGKLVGEEEGQALKDVMEKSKGNIKTLGAEQASILDNAGIKFSEEEVNKVYKDSLAKSLGALKETSASKKVTAIFNDLIARNIKGGVTASGLNQLRGEVDDLLYIKPESPHAVLGEAKAALMDFRTGLNNLLDSKMPENFAEARKKTSEAFKSHDLLMKEFPVVRDNYTAALAPLRTDNEKARQKLAILQKADQTFGTDLSSRIGGYIESKRMTPEKARELLLSRPEGQRLLKEEEQVAALKAAQEGEVGRRTQEVQDIGLKKRLSGDEAARILEEAKARGYGSSIGDRVDIAKKTESAIEAGFLGRLADAPKALAAAEEVKSGLDRLPTETDKMIVERLIKYNPQVQDAVAKIQRLGVREKLFGESLPGTGLNPTTVAKNLVAQKSFLDYEKVIKDALGVTDLPPVWRDFMLKSAMQGATQD